MADWQTLNQQLLDMISSMEEEGLVDHRLKLNRTLKKDLGVMFFARLISTFCTDCRVSLMEMTEALDKQDVDFYLLDQCCLKIKGGSSCLGAHRVALKCAEFRREAATDSRQGCIVALNALKHEYLMLQTKLDKVLELETNILSHQAPDHDD